MQLAWEAFLRRYRPMAHALAQGLTGEPDESEDIVQQATYALFRAHREDAERFESAQHARNWFLRTVRNLALQSRRDRSRLRRLEDEPPTSPDEERARAEVEARQLALTTVLRELDPHDRELVARRFLRKETLAQVSESTGVPISTLHSRERAILGRLRTRLERHEQEGTA